MEGAQQPASVGDALQETEVLVPKPGDEDFDPTVPQPGDDGYEEWLAAQAPPMRPSERADQEEGLAQRDTLSDGPTASDERPTVLGYLVPPRLAMELLGYLGQMPHDEVRSLIDGLSQATAIPAERAETSEPEAVDQPPESR